MTLVVIHPKAFIEIEASRKWYDLQSQGLGDRYIDEFDRGIEYTKEHPETWPVYVSGTRRYLLHRFPFAIVYSHSDTIIKVYAVMHLHRKPGYWLKRLI